MKECDQCRGTGFVSLFTSREPCSKCAVEWYIPPLDMSHYGIEKTFTADGLEVWRVPFLAKALGMDKE